jgi:hypothetical protein
VQASTGQKQRSVDAMNQESNIRQKQKSHQRKITERGIETPKSANSKILGYGREI